MEIVFALWLWLSTGEVQVIYGDQPTCDHVERSIAAGEQAELENNSGLKVKITKAICMGPINVDPCNLGELS